MNFKTELSTTLSDISNKQTTSTETLIIETRNHMINLVESQSKNEILKKISQNIAKTQSQEIIPIIMETNFIETLYQCLQNQISAIQSLECIRVLMKYYPSIIQIFYETDLISILSELIKHQDMKIAAFSAKSLRKLLKSMSQNNIDFQITREFIDSLLVYGKDARDVHLELFVKLMHEIAKDFDITECVLDFIILMLILLEHRSSSTVCYYLLLEMKIILEKYPDFTEEILSYPILDMCLESNLFNSNFDPVSVLDTIRFYIGLGNEQVNAAIQSKLNLQSILELLGTDNTDHVIAALLLLTSAIECNIITKENIIESNLIEKVFIVLEHCDMLCKEHCFNLLLTNTIVLILNIDQICQIYSNAFDMLENLSISRKKLLFFLIKYLSSPVSYEVQKIRETIEESDFMDYLESAELDETEEAYLNQIKRQLSDE